MGIDSRVLEAPKETHEKGEESKIIDYGISHCDQAHESHNDTVNDCCAMTAIFVNYPSYEKAAKDFTNTE